MKQYSVIFSSFLKVAAASALFGVVHSLLATLAAKDTTEQVLGSRQRNGLYRPFFILQSFLALAALWTYARPLPDMVLWRVRGFPAALLRLGQAAGLVYAIYTAAQVGITRISGLASLIAWAGGEEDVPPEPPAQGPSMGADGGLAVQGPFRWSRHPLNFAPLPVFWLNPVMTVKLLAFNLVSTLYLVLGSVHEEHRLRHRYGQLYRDYQASGVPFYVPRPSRRQPYI